MKKKLLFLSILFLFISVGVFWKLVCSDAEKEEFVDFSQKKSTIEIQPKDSILLNDGIYIGGLSVGNLTVSEARNLLEQNFSEDGSETVLIHWMDQEITTTFDQLGMSVGVEDALSKAVEYGCPGKSLIRQYEMKQDISRGQLHIEISRVLNQEKVAEFVELEIADEKDFDSVSARLEKVDGTLTVTNSTLGKKTDVEATSREILKAFSQWKEGTSLECTAVVNYVQPNWSTDQLSQVKDVLGDYSTTYLEDPNDRTDRATNVEVGCAFIDGTVVMPGESYSVSDLLHERNEENGYKTGGMMNNGAVEDSVGGGICQVSSTLYNALLEAEIQIDLRYPHSMAVKYIPPSKDAAIATGSKDLWFTNNKEYPIYIEGKTDGCNVYFTVYGKEDRPSNRRVEYVSVEDERIKSYAIEVNDPAMPTGTYRSDGSNHDEVTSHLEKIVYENGVEVSRETMYSDHYAPSFETVYCGTG